jgi:hypothetical protein
MDMELDRRNKCLSQHRLLPFSFVLACGPSVQPKYPAWLSMGNRKDYGLWNFEKAYYRCIQVKYGIRSA